MLNPFFDNRPIPNIKVKCKVKIRTKNAEESNSWNSFFSCIMGKPRTKIEFIAAGVLRNFPLSDVTVESIKNHITQEEYEKLQTIESIFNKGLPTDLKAFILAILQVPVKAIVEVASRDAIRV